MPADLQDLAARVCLWRLPGNDGKVRYIVVGPDHDLRELYSDAVPLFGRVHREHVRLLASKSSGESQ